ncbi:lytic transglycosylase domain-containing protein [Ornithinimicrobium cryptoxanthini]|uniref:Lytic transglycosylase domain-containing protein n=1 Tax=Ornithinimicrobium cryptoxanthini TaxID=2934161 RepID=A0ABY4YGK4_9MICO|nr:lytic transglycosylase domain-containing protein [Ornithinimicrobium cryptoxanthini]USQ75739.1 lytic transglycosylase domain-containing protein [Ornithinimicrobium cryptoxanthini]
MSNAPDITVLPNDEQTGKHRPGRRLHRGATALTAVIAAGAVAMATYAGTPSAPTLDADGAADSLSNSSPFAGEAALRSVTDGVDSSLSEAVDALEGQVSSDSLGFSAWSSRKAGDIATERATEIATERAAAEQAAAEQAAAEQAAAERAAAERAAAEQAAAEQAAAEQAAAEQAEQEQAASRSQERAAAPEPAPAPAPAPVSSGDPRSIARGMLSGYGWGDDQWGCLNSLWMRESGWNTYAQNPSSGAYGIPQSLPGNKMASAGSDWQTNPATQIRWGLGYISGRYGSPCGAWAHSESVGWY